jgi:hypothetical protein
MTKVRSVAVAATLALLSTPTLAKSTEPSVQETDKNHKNGKKQNAKKKAAPTKKTKSSAREYRAPRLNALRTQVRALGREQQGLRKQVTALSGEVKQLTSGPAPAPSPEQQRRLNQLEGELGQVRAKLAKLEKAVADGLDPSLVAVSMNRFRARMKSLESQIEQAKNRAEVRRVGGVVDRVNRLEQSFTTLNTQVAQLEQGQTESGQAKAKTTEDTVKVEAAATPPGGAEPTAAKEHQITLGKWGHLDFHGLLQGQFIGAFDDRDPYAGLGSKRATFRLRRAELALQGGMKDKVSFVVMLDFAKVLEFGTKSISVPSTADPTTTKEEQLDQPVSPISMLQDFVMTFRYIPYVDVSFGQTLTPISYEGLTPSGDMVFSERSEVGRFFGDQRDIGIWLHHRFKRFGYNVGVYNGAGPNQLDLERNKDLICRLEAYPLQALMLASSVQRTLAPNSERTQTLVGGDAVLRLGGLTAQAELYWRDQTSGDSDGSDVAALGTFGAVAYRFTSRVGDFIPGLRFDWFDPQRGVGDNDYWRLTAALNYAVVGSVARFRVNYVHTQARTRDASTGDLVAANNDSVIVESQVAF